MFSTVQYILTDMDKDISHSDTMMLPYVCCDIVSFEIIILFSFVLKFTEFQ